MLNITALTEEHWELILTSRRCGSYQTWTLNHEGTIYSITHNILLNFNQAVQRNESKAIVRYPSRLHNRFQFILVYSCVEILQFIFDSTMQAAGSGSPAALRANIAYNITTYGFFVLQKNIYSYLSHLFIQQLESCTRPTCNNTQQASYGH